jgi:hypothetical protein
MDVQEVFSNKFIEYGSRRQMEATLILKEFEVFGCNVGQCFGLEKIEVCEHHVRLRAQLG